jgi:hypothetical protein
VGKLYLWYEVGRTLLGHFFPIFLLLYILLDFIFLWDGSQCLHLLDFYENFYGMVHSFFSLTHTYHSFSLKTLNDNVCRYLKFLNNNIKNIFKRFRFVSEPQRLPTAMKFSSEDTLTPYAQVCQMAFIFSNQKNRFV